MIDSVATRIPHDAPFGPELDQIAHDLRRGFPTAGFRPSQHYALSGDLRQFGIPAILHLECRHTDGREHKLEIVETGSRSFTDVLSIIGRTFRIDPLTAEVMRIDLAADVRDVPVSYFEATMRTRFKRSATDIGDTQRMRIGAAELETIYVGRKPNCVRIYNKPIECAKKYRDWKRRFRNNACLLPFDRIFGFSEDAVLTRVERQIGARIPPQLATMADVKHNAAGFNPFENVQILARKSALPTVAQCGLTTWMIGTKLRELRAQMGMQRFRKFVNRHSKGNASRMIEQYAEFLNCESETLITSETLFGIYRESMMRQLAA